MQQVRRLWVLTWIAVAILAVWLRLPQGPEDRTSYMTQNDALYQLQRVQDTLDHYPRVPGFDPKLHHPTGYQLHWPALYPLALASLAKGLGIESQPDSLARDLGYLPILLSLIGLMGWMGVIRKISGSEQMAVAVGVLIAVNPYCESLSRYQAFDHHLFVDLALAGIAFAWVSGRSKLAMLAFALGLAMTPEFVFYGVALVGVWTWHRLCQPDDIYLTWAPSLLVALVWALDQGIQLGPVTWWSVYRLSGFHVAVFAAIASAGVLWSRFQPARLTWSLVGFGCTLAVGFMALLLLSGQWELLIERLGQVGRLSISEEQSPLKWPLLKTPPWVLIYVVPLVLVLGKAIDALRRNDRAGFTQSGLTLLVLLIGLREIRHFGSLQAAMIALSTLALYATWRKTNINLRLRRLLAVGLVLMAVWAFGLSRWRYQRAVQAGQQVELVAVQVPEWLRRATSVDDAVVAAWDYGHQIRVLAQRAVVLDPFNFPEPIDQRIEDLWLATSETQLVAAMDHYQARWLVVTNPTQSMLAVLDGSDPRISRYFGPAENGRRLLTARIIESPMMALWLGQGRFGQPAQLRLAKVSEAMLTVPLYDEAGLTKEIIAPAYAVFERVKGCTIEISHAPAKLRAELGYLTSSGFSWMSLQQDDRDPDRVVFRVALPAPWEAEGFRIPKPYRFTSNSHSLEVVVDEQDIRSGQQLKIDWDSDL